MLDTAALIAAIRSSTGAAAEVVRLGFIEDLRLLADYKLVCEYRAVALRPEHVSASGKTAEEISSLIERIESIVVPVLITLRHRPLSSDPNDDMVLDIAINGGADAIVTNNVRHFRSAAGWFGIEVFSPRDFLGFFRAKGG